MLLFLIAKVKVDRNEFCRTQPVTCVFNYRRRYVKRSSSAAAGWVVSQKAGRALRYRPCDGSLSSDPLVPATPLFVGTATDRRRRVFTTHTVAYLRNHASKLQRHVYSWHRKLQYGRSDFLRLGHRPRRVFTACRSRHCGADTAHKAAVASAADESPVTPNSARCRRLEYQQHRSQSASSRRRARPITRRVTGSTWSQIGIRGVRYSRTARKFDTKRSNVRFGGCEQVFGVPTTPLLDQYH